MPLAVIDPDGASSTTYYVHADHFNRPIAMTNSAKAFAARFTWLPYGGLHSYTGVEGIDLRFPGQLYQAESGLHYNWYRQYDPTTGRYTQPDPLGLIDGPSRYAYVTNDPMQLIDPDGRVAIVLAAAPSAGSWVSGLLGGAAVLIIGDILLNNENEGINNPAGNMCKPENIGNLPNFDDNAPRDECDEIYYADSAECGELSSPRQKAICRASATERLGNCIAGRPMQPLDKGKH